MGKCDPVDSNLHDVSIMAKLPGKIPGVSQLWLSMDNISAVIIS